MSDSLVGTEQSPTKPHLPDADANDTSAAGVVSAAEPGRDVFTRARRCLTDAVQQSAANLRWKVWLRGARLEMRSSCSSDGNKLSVAATSCIRPDQVPL